MRSRLRLPLLSLFFFVAAPVVFTQTSDLSGTGFRDRSAQYVPNQLLVRFRSSVAQNSAMETTIRLSAKVVQDFANLPGLQLVQLEPGADFNAALASYRRDPSVMYAEPNYIRKALDNIPNDTYFHDLWNMHNVGQPILLPFPPLTGAPTAIPGDDIHALEAWGITTGSSSVVIGLIDTGIDVNHEDLAANIYRNDADCFSDGIDHDGNGYKCIFCAIAFEFLHHFLYALSLTHAGIERRRRHFAAALGFGYDSQVSAPLLKRQIVARIFVKAFPFRGAIKPGIHFIRKCQNGTTAFSRRPVDRESKLHFIPLNCADAASSVVRNVFPRMQHFPFIGCISEGGVA